MPLSAGRARSSRRKASSPPADAPIPTIGNGAAGRRGAVFCSTAVEPRRVRPRARGRSAGLRRMLGRPLVLPQAVVEGLDADPERLGSLFLVAFEVPERCEDQPSLRLRE